ncbi:MAG: hypothetical protein CL920_26460 [Deltaproteobacteria bacterium]|nr:hypothetical protein [Deltaproteobacteria bacterium]|tara:strand:+ start:3057 stop:4439 length:1383 start_codon:yes stop_codon:yes gene_type:complete
MDLVTLIKRIDHLHKQLEELRPIPPDRMRRILQKFRLDWNYHSNSIEGNSLNFGETKTFLLHGLTAKGKPLRDHLDIQGHDEAIKYLEELVKDDERPLTQNLIRELHRLILKDPGHSWTENAEGHKIPKKIKVGQYKTTPNHVRTMTGEIFYFAEPHEVPAKMDDMLRAYQKDREEQVHPLFIAAKLHYSFVRIHPFDDGNGRISRLLMNLVLMNHRLPMVVVKTEDKDNYYRALRQADGGDIEAFVSYIGEQLVHSLELMLKGAKGENIDEAGDVDKKLDLLKRRLQGLGQKPIKEKRTFENTLQFCVSSIAPLTRSLVTELSKFNDLFHEQSAKYNVNVSNWTTVDLFDKQIMRPGYLEEYFEKNSDKELPSKLALQFWWDGLITSGTEAFQTGQDLDIVFRQYHIGINDRSNKSRTKIKKLYHETLQPEEIELITKELVDEVLETLNQWIEQKESNS